jgi:hypothetical protein
MTWVWCYPTSSICAFATLVLLSVQELRSMALSPSQTEQFSDEVFVTSTKLVREFKRQTEMQGMYHKQTFLCLRKGLCGLVVRVPGYKSRGPGFDFQRYQIFREVVGLERGPLSLVSTIEELLGRKNSGFGLENREYGRWIRFADLFTPSNRKSWH